MAASSFSVNQNANGDMSELRKDLERMIENTEKMSLQLTWMAHDVVVLRTDPGLASSMQKLEEAHRGCRAAVCGAPEAADDPAGPAGDRPY